MNTRFRLHDSAAFRHNRKWRSLQQFARFLGVALTVSGITIASAAFIAQAQESPEASTSEGSGSIEFPAPASTQPTFALPTTETPVVVPPPAGQYVLEFNRSPVVGNRLRLESIYDEARLRFTRPQHWQPTSAKVLLRFRHSAALYASRSNLTVLVNGTSVGSVPLNKPQGEIGSVAFNIPPDLIQDYNEVTLAALQNNSPTCTQDPYDPSLWTEILPDSKLVFDFEPQPVSLDFSRYPYPIYDILSLEANQVAYLQPETINESWLTATTRYHTSLGRVAEYRSLETRLVNTLDEINDNERLIIIGTPANQPALSSLDLPLPLEDGQLLDAEQKVLPDDVGVLLLTTLGDRVPVLVATGNSEAGVAKAVQFLVQSPDQKIGTGNVIFVNQVTDIPSPPPRQWARYLPLENSFQLSDLRTFNDEPYQDVMVRGSHAPALEFDFRALPDDQFLPGSTMTLRYSYGPQVNPVTSLVEVELDGIPVDGRRLSSINGGNREELRVELPGERIKPNSKIQVNFRLDPRERRSCSRVTDQQLWGTIHADTDFDLKRQNVVKLPELELFRFGYPFAAPQDLASTAIVVPDNPTPADLLLLLETGERLGRISQAESVKLEVYRASQLPPEERKSAHLIGIGTQANFPFPEVFKAEDGFALNTLSVRQWQQSQIQATPDAEGVVKQVVSPWNNERVLLALSSQTPTGLSQVRDLLAQDPLFYQLEGDTVLISANTSNPSPYDANDYTLEFLRQSPQRQIVGDRESWWLLLRSNWLILVPALVAASLVLYGIAQLYLKRISLQQR